MRQFDRSKTICLKRDIQTHTVQIQTTAQRQIGTVRSIDRQTVEIDMVMAHNDGCLTETNTDLVGFVLGRYAKGFHFGRYICFMR